MPTAAGTLGFWPATPLQFLKSHHPPSSTWLSISPGNHGPWTTDQRIFKRNDAHREHEGVIGLAATLRLVNHATASAVAGQDQRLLRESTYLGIATPR